MQSFYFHAVKACFNAEAGFGPSYSCFRFSAVARPPVRASIGCCCFMLASSDLPSQALNRSIHRSFVKPLRVIKVTHAAFRRVASMSVQEYIDKHDLSKKVEEVINACVKAKPEEPISFMVRCCAIRHEPKGLQDESGQGSLFIVYCDRFAGRAAEAILPSRDHQGSW